MKLESFLHYSRDTKNCYRYDCDPKDEGHVPIESMYLMKKDVGRTPPKIVKVTIEAAEEDRS